VSGLCIPGAIVTMAGVVLAVQNTFDLYATWAYAWALVAPGGAGLGLFIQGLTTGRPALRAAGLRTMGIGAALFLVGAAFFEGVLHLSGKEFGFVGQLVLPLLLIAAGAWLLVRRALPARR
jgi:lipopolysaccharide export LptBFGC system permease protein LptF